MEVKAPRPHKFEDGFVESLLNPPAALPEGYKIEAKSPLWSILNKILCDDITDAATENCSSIHELLVKEDLMGLVSLQHDSIICEFTD
jgi:hypothetical protein